jgi:hypothetical protein
MAAPVISYTFSNGTTSDASQVNQNFTDLINALTDGTADLTFGSAVISGALSAGGNVILGNAASDTLTIGGTVVSSLLPTDATYDLGSAVKQWKDLYLSGNAVFGGNLTVGGTLALTGALTLNGNVEIGNAVGDTLTITATLTSNLLPTAATYSIGSTSQSFKALYLDNASVNGGAIYFDASNNSGIVVNAAGASMTFGPSITSMTTTGSFQSAGLTSTSTLSVGTTSTFTGNATFSALALHPVGSAAAPTVAASTATTTGLYFIAAGGYTGITSAGVDCFQFNVSDGDVVIRGRGAAAKGLYIQTAVSDGLLSLSPDTSSGAGANMIMYAGSHASLSNKWAVRQGSTDALTVTGSALVTIGASGGTQTHAVNGLMAITKTLGVGGANSTSSIINVGATNPLTGAYQDGIVVTYTATSAATSEVLGIVSQPTTANSSFTVPYMSCFYAYASRAKGAASAITRRSAYSGDMPTDGAANCFLTDSVNGFASGTWGIYLATTNANYVAGKMTAAGGHQTKHVAANISDPPTAAELISAFGAAATAGAGFMGTIIDNSGGTKCYKVWTDGSAWLFALGTVAA